MSARRKSFQSPVFTIVATVLGLLSLEGIATLALRAADRNDPARRPVAERKHTQYDPELGWVNAPSVHLPDLYGPGRSLTTNAQGFRATRDYPRVAPEGKVRLLCSGDSFTLGWGVDDADTWCAHLERLDDRIETVNMGQGGYGIDQAYLWARRDGGRVEHQLHLFAFISEDFHRLRYDRFLGYGKPTLRVENGVPVASSVPVPERRTGMGRGLDRLNMVRMMRRLLGRTEISPPAVLALSEAAALAELSLETLDRENRERGSRLIAIWLPTLPDYLSRGNDRLRGAVLGNLAANDVLVIDLVEDLRRLPAAEVDILFLKPGDVVYPSAGRHYSAAGNAFVAAALWARLKNLPPFDGESSPSR